MLRRGARAPLRDMRTLSTRLSLVPSAPRTICFHSCHATRELPVCGLRLHSTTTATQPGAEARSRERTLFRAEKLWPVRVLTAFCVVDTVGTAVVFARLLSHSEQLDPDQRLLYVGAFGLFACVPPLLLGVLHWVRTRLVVELTALPGGRVRLVFAPLLPGADAQGLIQELSVKGAIPPAYLPNNKTAVSERI